MCEGLIPSVMIQDEADEMLSRGFKDQIYDVYRYLPPELQVTIGTYSLGTNDSFSFFFCLQFCILSEHCVFFHNIIQSATKFSVPYTMTYDMHVSNFL